MADGTDLVSAVSDPQAMANMARFTALEVALAIWVMLYLFFFSKFLGFFLSLLLNMVGIPMPLRALSSLLHFSVALTRLL